MKKVYIYFIVASLLPVFLNAQYTTDRPMGVKNELLIDSLKTMHYPYLLPIWGQKIVNKGFNLPYSAGISTQYLWQRSDIIINDLSVGFNNGSMYNLDQIVRFEQAQTNTNGINIRPDIWLFPFLNVYAIFGRSTTSTSVKCGLWVPDSSKQWNKIMDFGAKADFNATTIGFGMTPTVGIGGFFVALDMNFSWTDIPELDKPAYAFIFGPRIGKSITLKKESSVTLWAGGFRVQLNSSTKGSLNVSDLLPLSTWQNKLDSGMQKVANSQQKVDAWWTGLSPVEQKNPVNIAKYQTANTALTKAGDVLSDASQAIQTAGNATVQYSLNKRPADKWNFIIGGQYQINKHFMFRAEYGFLSSRQQFIGGFQYRFNL